MQKLVIHVRRSKQFLSLQGLMLIVSWFVVWYVPIGWGIKIFLFIGTTLYGYKIYQGHQSHILSHDSSNWSIDNMPIELCGDSTITNYICVVRYKIQNKRWKFSLVLWRDSMKADEYREIIVRMST